MASAKFDRGRCLRYKSDLQSTTTPATDISTVATIISTSSPPPPAPSIPTPVPITGSGHGALFFWTFVAFIVFLLYLISRRRQDENQTEENETLKPTNDEQQTTQIRSSPIQILPTITEENFHLLTPNEFQTNFSSTNFADQVSGHSDREHPSLVSAQRAINETNETIYFDEETAHPIIFRKICSPHQEAIGDEFNTLEEINQAVKDVGLVRSQLIFGIDYTISNLETGKYSFNGLSLHHIEEGLLNPYQRVITIIGRTLEKFDSDSLIPAFGFGDRTTLDRKIFPLRPDGSYCRGFRGVLQAYNKITPKVRMSGPTNFAPLIKEAIRIVKKTGQYHILVIVADGQVTNERQTKEAIVEASHYPLSIVMIGVGDGPWDMMEEFDDSLPTREFDNFQFVNYNSVIQASLDTESDFALHALMEIPSQYAAIKRLGLLKDI